MALNYIDILAETSIHCNEMGSSHAFACNVTPDVSLNALDACP